MLRQAVRRGWLNGPNPLDRLERPPTQGPGRDVSLTHDEARRLLAELSGRLYYKVALDLYTGLRWGELHGLAWADIDLESNPPTLTVRRSYHGKPKNQASAATVPLSDEAAGLLRRWRVMQPGPWVFPSRNGKLPTRSVRTERDTIHATVARLGNT